MALLEVGAGGGSIARWRTAGVIDAYLGRRLPALVADLAFVNFSFDVFNTTFAAWGQKPR